MLIKALSVFYFIMVGIHLCRMLSGIMCILLYNGRQSDYSTLSELQRKSDAHFSTITDQIIKLFLMPQPAKQTLAF